jgi:DnaJ-class molecular chaperone
VLGGKVPVPTTTGTVTLTVPPWSSSGKMLRLRGKGVVRPDGSRGDQYATVKIVLPDGPDPELESFMAGWRQGQGQDPRRKAEA